MFRTGLPFIKCISREKKRRRDGPNRWGESIFKSPAGREGEGGRNDREQMGLCLFFCVCVSYYISCESNRTTINAFREWPIYQTTQLHVAETTWGLNAIIHCDSIREKDAHAVHCSDRFLKFRMSCKRWRRSDGYGQKVTFYPRTCKRIIAGSIRNARSKKLVRLFRSLYDICSFLYGLLLLFFIM